jgi:ATP-binding cassette subfamily F protein uup
MALIINCQSIGKTFGARPLFENISMTISDGERIGLIGPNGAGKSTFLQILAGIQKPDEGEVATRKLLRSGYVPQDPTFEPHLTVEQVAVSAFEDEHLEDYEKEAMVGAELGRWGFSEPEALASTLSGGWRKRLAILRETVRKPDVLLLDEPTNHLDLDGILYLEKVLRAAPFASVTVSHDRYFLENLATDMAEINRTYPDGLFRVRGNYSEFLIKREEFLITQSKYQEALANKVTREVEWLRRGPKARTTKSKARIDSAGELIEELAEVSERNSRSTARIEFNASERKTKRLVVAKNISKSMGGRTLFENVNLTLTPGMRLGVVGANGAGKTTVLRVLTGELDPDSGTIERADNLRVVYFDQNREDLDPTLTLRRALASHGDSVIFQDKPVHVASWASRFLFRNEQLDMQVGRLSGGEKARVLIARLMLQPADVLFMDEPTNDLDIPTLEVLEESLIEFPGALVLVTHDRFLLDRVATTVFGIDSQGTAGLFADYSQWEAARLAANASTGKVAQSRTAPAGAPSANAAPLPPPAAKKRLSYIENREWEQIEDLIEKADQEVVARQRALDDPTLHRDSTKLQEAYEQLRKAQQEAERLFVRWAELEEKLKG